MNNPHRHKDVSTFTNIIPEILRYLSKNQKTEGCVHSWEIIKNHLLCGGFLREGDIDAEFAALLIYLEYAQYYCRVSSLCWSFEFNDSCSNWTTLESTTVVYFSFVLFCFILVLSVIFFYAVQ